MLDKGGGRKYLRIWIWLLTNKIPKNENVRKFDNSFITSKSSWTGTWAWHKVAWEWVSDSWVLSQKAWDADTDCCSYQTLKVANSPLPFSRLILGNNGRIPLSCLTTRRLAQPIRWSVLKIIICKCCGSLKVSSWKDLLIWDWNGNVKISANWTGREALE